MTKLTDLANSVKVRVFGEFAHAPISFIAAVVTLIDIGLRLLVGHDGSLPPAAHVPNPSNQNLGLPEPLVLLEFIGFQVAIAFIVDWLNERAARLGISLAIVAGIFTAVLAAYLTAANSFRLASFLIQNEGQTLGAFDGAIIASTVLVLVLMIVLLGERNYESDGAWETVGKVLYRIGPFVFLILLALTHFAPQFEARLQALYNAKVDQRNFGK